MNKPHAIIVKDRRLEYRERLERRDEVRESRRGLRTLFVICIGVAAIVYGSLAWWVFHA